MRLVAFALLILAVSAVQAQGPKNRAGKKSDEARKEVLARVDALIKEAFDKADRKRNDVLSKTEFRKASAMLEAGLVELARQGVLGVPRPPKMDQALDATAVLPDKDLSKSNQVTRGDFIAYAYQVAARVDAQALQARAIVAAQQKGKAARNPRAKVGRGRAAMGRRK